MANLNKRTALAERIQYNDLCIVLNEFKNKNGKRSFEEFLKHWYDEMGKFDDYGNKEYHPEDSLYPAMRLIVPMKDETRTYALGVTRLVYMVAKGLGLQPSKSELKDVMKLDEEEAARELSKFVGTRRGRNLDPTLSIADVNKILDDLSVGKTDSDKKEEAVKNLLKKSTVGELYWIFLTLTKKMENVLGVNFGMYAIKLVHPGCSEKLNAGSSLQEVIDEVCSASIEERPIDIAQILCRKIKPMLLKGLTHKLSDFNKIIKICGRPFYLEQKYDGEHVIVHKYGVDGGKYNYFTRNRFDCTRKYGADSHTNFSAIIHGFFKSTVTNCVLDCEILLWDKVLKKFVGKNQRASDGKIYDVKYLDEHAFGEDFPLKRCLAVFDLLYLNDESFVDKNLEERIGILNSSVFEKVDPCVIFISKKESITKRDEFIKFYNESMRASHEGIVVKGCNTKYKMGSRAERNGWFKIKPDYGGQTTLDLAIVAARVTKYGKFETFYVAAKDGPGTSKMEMKYRMVVPLMSIIKKVDADHLMSLVKGEKGWLPEGETPIWITNPDFVANKKIHYIRRDQIVVVEIRASGVKDGSLQYPRIAELRQDKNANEINTVADVLKLEDNLREYYSDGADDEEIKEPAKKRRRVLTVPEGYRLIKPNSTILCLSSGLKGKKVCVLQGDNDYPNQQMQEILQSLGATVIANSTPSTDFLVATNPKHIKVAGTIKRNTWNIVHSKWVLKCKDALKLLPWTDDDMIHKADGSKFELFSYTADETDEQAHSSNTYSEQTPLNINNELQHSPEALSTRSVSQSSEDDMEKTSNVNDREREETQANEFTFIDAVPQAMIENLFEEFIFFIHGSLHENMANECKHLIEHHNGKVSEKLDDLVTHVVVGRVTNDEMDNLFNWNEKKYWLGCFVSKDWLENAIADDDRYLTPLNLNQMVVS